MSARNVNPSSYNLLELYRKHRDEIDAITDPTTLFILAFTNQLERAQLDELAGDLGLSLATLRIKLMPLLRGQLANLDRESLTVTTLGKRVLEELGLIGLPLPPSRKPPEPPKPPTTPATTAGTPGWLWGIIAFLGTAAVVLIVALIIGALVVPGIINPPVPTITPILATSVPPATSTFTATPSPTPSATPLPSSKATATPSLTPTSAATATATVTLSPTPTATPTITPSSSTIKLDSPPISLIFHPTGKQVFVGTYDSNLHVYDSETRRVLRSMKLPESAIALAISSKEDRLYVATVPLSLSFERTTSFVPRGSVFTIDTNTLDIVAKASLQFTGIPRLVLSEDERWLYLTDSFSGGGTTLLILETGKLGTIARVKDGTLPGLVDQNAPSNLLYVPAQGDDVINVYDTRPERVAVMVAAGAFDPISKLAVKGGPNSVQLSDDTTQLYIGFFNLAQIAVANTKTLKVEQSINIPAGTIHTAMTPDGRRLVAISATTNRAFVVDTVNNRFLFDLPIDTNPFYVATSPNNHVAWIATTSEPVINVLTFP